LTYILQQAFCKYRTSSVIVALSDKSWKWSRRHVHKIYG
jgi:hypothetical protein